MTENQTSDKKVSKITMGSLLSWAIGVFLIILGIAQISGDSTASGVWFLIASCIALPPVIHGAEKRLHFSLSRGVRIFFIAVLIVVGVSTVNRDTNQPYLPVSQTPPATQQTVNNPSTLTPVKNTTPDSTPTPTPKPASSETVSQINAVRKAKSYLGYTAFSRDGLVTQLEYEKFSHADAVYGADNSGANWNEQSAKKAKAYMVYSAFSRDGLIAQLEYEKFTREQAEYGANAVGL